MMDHTAQTLTLRDGRTLGYAEWGDPDGKPILLFGGSTSSRLQRPADDASQFAPGVRLYTFDRPGTGLSTRQPNRTLLDWPDDIRDFARQKHLDQFAVVGGSLGGAYAVACAYALPDLLVCASVISGVSGLGDAEVFATQTRATRSLIATVRRFPQFAAFQNNLSRPLINSRFGKRVLRSALGILPQSDQDILDQPENMQIMYDSARECLSPGGAGAVDDMRAVVNDWAFKLEDIRTKVFIWQGEDDPQAPPAMARYMAARIPANEATFLANAGHLLIISHWRHILQQILDVWPACAG
ncbi:MAG TPA: alpha/beta hydrolase [Aggregatilineales bacterium]|nr:alpha/beta hydrolase [Aggregatilineales bacterium]